MSSKFSLKKIVYLKVSQENCIPKNRDWRDIHWRKPSTQKIFEKTSPPKILHERIRETFFIQMNWRQNSHKKLSLKRRNYRKSFEEKVFTENNYLKKYSLHHKKFELICIYIYIHKSLPKHFLKINLYQRSLKRFFFWKRNSMGTRARERETREW